MADYIIVKFFEEMSFRTKGAQRERYPAWGKVTVQRAGKQKGGKQAHLKTITREKARELIARRGLVEYTATRTASYMIPRTRFSRRPTAGADAMSRRTSRSNSRKRW